MKKYELTVNGKSARFLVRDDWQDFSEALNRGAAKLGYHGGSWRQPNFEMNWQVTVTDRAPRGSNGRQSYNGVCVEV